MSDPLAALLAEMFPAAERTRWPFTVDDAADRLRAAGVTLTAEPGAPVHKHSDNCVRLPARRAVEVRAVTPTTRCTCLPLNRKLMAVLLKVDEGSVHEQGCVENAAQEARQQERERLAARVEALLPHPSDRSYFEEGWLDHRAAVLSILRGEDS